MDNDITHTNVFIAIAPNHILNFEHMLDNSTITKDTILLNPGNFEYNKHIWTEVINGALDLKYTQSNSIKKIKYQAKKLLGYKSYINKIREYLKLSDKYNYYYCNLDDVLTNCIFHYLNKKTTVNNYVVEDGILNYYYPEINTSKLNSKKIFSKFFLGIDFVPIDKHPTNIHSDLVISQYVRLPQNSIYPEKSVQLPFEKISYNPLNKITLIIGQDIMHNGSEGLPYYKNRLRTLFNHVKSSTSATTKIIYKPHRNGDYSIAEDILELMFNDYELFKDVTPIEKCITLIKPSKIYSFESSAMLNLKMAFDMTNVHMAVLPYSKKQSNLIGIFNNLEIVVLQ